MIAGVAAFGCFLILAVVSLFDATEILGVNRWIKPMKFFVSIAIYSWTVAVYLHFPANRRKAARFISWATILVFAVEMVIITGQAARGTTSHFNTRTPLDGVLFSIMGAAITFNTLLAGYLLYLYFKAEIDLPKSVIWGMRLGLLLFLAASFEGGYMSAQIGHTIGAADGGAGLPVVNWSTRNGDLRVAHFVGMHAFQAVPFFAYTMERYKIKSPTFWTFVFAAAYFALFTFVFVQALAGKPFWG
jgi:hypothetical protein